MPKLTPCRRHRVAFLVVVAAAVALLGATPGRADSAASRADLQLTTFTLDKSTVSGTGPVTAKVVLTNSGPAVASSITVKFDLVPANSVAKRQTLTTRNAGTLARKTSTSIVTNLTLPFALTPGTYNVVATASSSVQDPSPANNIASRSLQIQAATSSTTSTSTTTSATPAATSCTKYQSFFDGVHQSAASSLNAQAASGDGSTYSTFSYPLDGILGMFEGTHDVKYLEQALAWAEQMVKGATIVDIHGKRNWKGPWASPYSSTPITYQLHEFQGAPPLARLARIILTNPGLKATYGVRAQAIYRFVKDHIADKWLYARKAESTFRYQVTHNRTYPGPMVLFSRLVLDLARIDGNLAYRSLVGALIQGFIARTEPYSGGSLVWDLGDSAAVAGQSVDTSGAGRYPFLAAEAYAAGIGFTQAHVAGLARLLTEVIWDKSTTSPRFTNLIDGKNPWVGSNPPYGLGQIYSGWATLGAHDSRARLVAEATLKAIIAGVRNPSLDLMRSSVGQMELAGHVTKNMRVSGSCGVIAIADIVASSLKLGSATLIAGGSTPLQVSVSNQGTGLAQSVAVAISLSGGGSTSRIGTINVGTLSAGASGTFERTLTAPSVAGTYTVIAAAATPDPEVTTTNNAVATTLGVSSPTITATPSAVADIASSALTLGATTLSAGSTTSLKATVSNLGTATAQSVAVAISLAGGATTSRIAQINVGALSAGASGTVATTLTAPMSPGTYTVIASATTPDAEATTANNTATTTLGVSTSTTSTPLTTSTTPTTSTTTYYVSKTGSDANSCANAQNAADTTKHKLTINGGLACLAAGAGDTLNIGPGIYNEAIIRGAVPSGASSAARTTIRARTPIRTTAHRGNPSPTIDSAIHTIIKPATAGACTVQSVMQIGNKNFITFDGLVFDGNNLCTLVIRFDEATRTGGDGTLTYIQFTNGVIQGGLGGTGAYATSSHVAATTQLISTTFTHIDYINNEFGPIRASNSCLSNDSSDSVIEYNYMHGCGNEGIETHHAWPPVQSTNLTIRYNKIKDTGNACFILSGVNHLVYNNLCINNGGGTRFDGTVSQEAVIVVIAANEGQASSGVKFFNNTIYSQNGSLGCVRIPNTGATANHEFRNNICYGGVNDTLSSVVATTVSNNRCNGALCTTTANPMFKDAANDDFHLTATSPATIVNAGVDLPAYVTMDFEGTFRPQGSGVDLGAFEWVP